MTDCNDLDLFPEHLTLLGEPRKHPSAPQPRAASTRYPTLSAPAPDVLAQSFGSLYVLWSRTEEARVWFRAHVDVRETWGEGIVCEPRHVEAIAQGLSDAGFELMRG